MKLSSFIIAMAVLLAAGTGAFASEKTKAPPQPKATAEKTKSKTPTTKQQYTGSYVRKDVRQSGHITDSAQPLFVIDSKTIQNSGAADLRQLLVRQGFNH